MASRKRHPSLAVSLPTAMLLLFLNLSAGGNGDPGPAPWLPYEPTVIELSGRLTVAVKFGPPNYGEDPKTDLRLKIPILVLEEPVNVRGDPRSDVNIESVRDVKQLQLILPRQREWDDLVNRPVVVQGTLSHAVSGGEFTEVVLTVQKISAAPE